MIQTLIDKLSHDRNKRLRTLIAVVVVAAMVAASVFWVMRIIGITMTDEPGCGIPEHHHTEECIVSRTLICGMEESDGHHHTDECYEIVYGCGMEEHTHSVLCYPDPDADKETESDWLATIPAAEMNGEWLHDIVAIARSQVGYEESVRNYILNENKEHKGYTRYGAWYGAEYIDWDAIFAAFCLNYAGVPSEFVPYNSGAEAFRAACAEAMIFVGNDQEPVPGDIVFFDLDGDGVADRVGIVTDIKTETVQIQEPEQPSDNGSETTETPEDSNDETPGDNNNDETPGDNNSEETPGDNNNDETPGDNNNDETPGDNNNDETPGDNNDETPADNNNEENAGGTRSAGESDPADTRSDEQDANEPETNDPETNEPETNEPETNEPETNEPETNEPEPNEPVSRNTNEQTRSEERTFISVVEGDRENAVREVKYDLEDAVILGYVNIGAARDNYIAALNTFRLRAPYMTSGLRGAISSEANTDRVFAHVEWDDGDNHDSVVVTVALKRNGVTVETRELNKANNWQYVFTGLTRGSYTIEYSEPYGFVSESDLASMETQTWEPMTVGDTFTVGRVYAIVLRSETSGGGYSYGSIGAVDRHSDFLDFYPSAAGSDGILLYAPEEALWKSQVKSTSGEGSSGETYTGTYLKNDFASYSGNDGSYNRYMYIWSDATADSGYTFGTEKLKNLTTSSSNSDKRGLTYFYLPPANDIYSGGIDAATTSSGTYYWFRYGENRYGVYDTLAVSSKSQRTNLAMFRLVSTSSNKTADCTITLHRQIDVSVLEPRVTHNKTVDWLGGGSTNTDTTLSGEDYYRLYLDVRGKTEPIDVLLVVDRSNSMLDVDIPSDSSYVSRLQAVNNFINGEGVTSGTPQGFIKAILDANPYNRIAVISYGSVENGSSTAYLADSTVWYTWGRPESPIVITKNPNSDGGGTNYTAGIYRAEDMLNDSMVANDGHRKIVIFLSDGSPTYAVTSKTATSRVGDGTSNTTAVSDATFIAIYTTLNDLVNSMDVQFNSIAFHAEGMDEAFLIDFLAEIASEGGGNYTEATTADQLTAAIRNSIFPSSVYVTDQLSDYVEYYDAQPDLKVTRTVNGTTTEVWPSGSSGIIQSCTVNNGKITLKFDPDYALDPSEIFTVSFNVQVSQAAKDEYNENQDYGDTTGDYGTDHDTAQKTSSSMPGFYSNTAASVEYGMSGKYYREPYRHPVIQVVHETDTQTYEDEYAYSKTIDWLGDGADNPYTEYSAADMYRLNLDFWADFNAEPYDLMLVIDKSASMLWDIYGNETSSSGLPSREELVERALNGYGSNKGMIRTFLDAHPYNRVSVITFGGTPQERMVSNGYGETDEFQKFGEYLLQEHDGGSNYYLGVGSDGAFHGYSSSEGTGRTWTATTYTNESYNVEGYYLLKTTVGSTTYYLSNSGGSICGLSSLNRSNALLVKRDSNGRLLIKYYNGSSYVDRYLCYNSSDGYYMSSSSTYAVNVSLLTDAYSYDVDTAYVRDWGRSTDPVELDVVDNTGTNYEAGLQKAAEIWSLSQSPNKIMVFISDGVPTYWINDNGSRGGNGSATNTANVDSARNGTISAAEWFHALFPDVKCYSILFESDPTVDVKALDAIASSHKSVLASNIDELEKILTRIIKPENIRITDVLSKYVRLDPSDADITVSRVRTFDGKITVLYKNGEFMNGGADIIDSVVYTPDDTSETPYMSTGSIVLNFKPEFEPNAAYTYVLSFNVHTTKTAENDKLAYVSNEMDPYGGTTGDADTDFEGNTTSSGKPGFHSNSTALLEMDYGDHLTLSYDHPVVQVKTVSDQSTSVTVTKTWNDDGYEGIRPESIEIHLYRTSVVDGETVVEDTGLTHMLTADEGWTYTWENLPAFDSEGNHYSYYTEETPIYGYTTTYGPVVHTTEMAEATPTPVATAAPTAAPTTAPTAVPSGAPTTAPTTAPVTYEWTQLTVDDTSNFFILNGGTVIRLVDPASGTAVSNPYGTDVIRAIDDENDPAQWWSVIKVTSDGNTFNVLQNVKTGMYLTYDSYRPGSTTYYYLAGTESTASSDHDLFILGPITSTTFMVTNYDDGEYWYIGWNTAYEFYRYYTSYNYGTEFEIYVRGAQVSPSVYPGRPDMRSGVEDDTRRKGSSGSPVRGGSSSGSPMRDETPAAPSAEETWAEYTGSIQTGVDYLITYTASNGDIYVLLNFAPNPPSGGSQVSNYFFVDSGNNYNAYAVKAITDSDGHIIGLDDSVITGLNFINASWQFESAGGGKYRIASQTNDGYYLNVTAVSGYDDVYPMRGYELGSGWTWSNNKLTHTFTYNSTTSTRRMKAYSVNAYPGIHVFGAGEDVTADKASTLKLYVRVNTDTGSGSGSGGSGGSGGGDAPTPTFVSHHWDTSVYNTILTEPFAIVKIGAHYDENILTQGTALIGVEFKLYRTDDSFTVPDDAVAYQTQTTGPGGRIDFTALPYGHYVLKETAPPAGYAAAGPWHVTVDENGASITDANGESLRYTTGADDTPVIENYASYELPHTGGVGTALFTFGGFAMILMPVTVWIARFKERWKGKGGRLRKLKDRPPRNLE